MWAFGCGLWDKFYFLGNVGHGADLLQLIPVGLRWLQPGPGASWQLAALLPVCLEADLFPAGLKSAKGITCSLLTFALSWPAVTWVGLGGQQGWDPAPHATQTDCPKAPISSPWGSPCPLPYKPTAPVPPPTGGA